MQKSQTGQTSEIEQQFEQKISEFPRQRFLIQKKIGEGSYGIVEKAYDKQKDQTVAIKTMKINSQTESLPHYIVREVSFLIKMKDCKGCVELLDIFKELNFKEPDQPKNYFQRAQAQNPLADITHLHQQQAQQPQNQTNQVKQQQGYSIKLVFPFYQQGDLLDFMNKKALPPVLAADYAQQMLEALVDVHENCLIHRDVKPQNILVGDENSREAICEYPGRQILLADFGLSRQMSVPPQVMTKEIQSLWYRAPEVLLNNLNYTQAVDIWSVGAILDEMLSGEIKFRQNSEIAQILEIFKDRGTPSEITLRAYNRYDFLVRLGLHLPKFEKKPFEMKFGHGFDQLIDDMLQLDPSKRPTAKQALVKICQIKDEIMEQVYEPGHYQQ